MPNALPGTSAHAPVEVNWIGGEAFEAGRPHGPTIRIDGNGQSAPSPFDVLLAAIAACAMVDLVAILAKQRAPVQALNVRIEAQRIDATPRRLSSATLRFRIRAPGATLEKATRAVELSVSKYCSVRSSLIAEATVTWQVELAS
ncbi:MAG: OsmC family protein [Steroidobacteraceae bacterium]